MRTNVLSVLAAVAIASAAGGEVRGKLKVLENTDGSFAVCRDGTNVLENIRYDLGPRHKNVPVKRTLVTTADGSRVWNVWNEDRATRFRMEVCERSDGAVEISLAGQMEYTSPCRTRFLKMDLPRAFAEGAEYEGLKGSGRKYEPVKGTFDGKFRSGGFRWLATRGIVFDFNPFGATQFSSAGDMGIKGVWNVHRNRKGGGFGVSGGSTVNRTAAGYAGAKLVLRTGSNADYRAYHLIPSYVYSWHLAPSRLLRFGARKAGKNFGDGNVPYDERRGFGWVSSETRTVNPGVSPGAYCSCVSGRDGVYRFSGLANGWYVATVAAGNPSGVENACEVSVGGEILLDRFSVPAGKVRTVSKAVFLRGTVDVAFKGGYAVSVLALQPLMAEAEDFVVSRGFWLTDGYEPGSIYRNADVRAPFVPALADDTFDLPVPGKSRGKPHEMPRPVAHADGSDPALAWTRNARICRLFANGHTLAELDDPAERAAYFDANVGTNFNAVMLSGMHSRHTFPAHLEDGLKAIGRIADECHRRGLALIDHHDSTVLWYEQAGLRVLMERLPELVRGTDDLLPSFQLCPNNPSFNEKYVKYLRGSVAAGSDGFQIDELRFWPHGCACVHCRRRFFEETGVEMPVDETSPAARRADDPTHKLLRDWRRTRTTNWFADLRRSLRDIRPNLVLNNYTTYYGFISSLDHDMIDQCRVLDLVGIEVMPRNPFMCARPLVPLTKMSSSLNLAYGVPVWGWYYASNWQSVYFCWAVANMHGQSSLLPSDSKAPATAPDWLKFGGSAANMRRAGAETVAEVAVLFSVATRDWGTRNDFDEEILGVAQGLEALHVPYEIILDTSLSEASLKKYKLLFLGDSVCLSDAAVAAIRAFAARGGRVVMSSGAGACDGFGTRRKGNPLEGIGSVVSLEAKRFCARSVKNMKPWTYALADSSEERACFERLRTITEPFAWWRVRAPAQVFAQPWREADGTLALHFLNATAACPELGVPMTAEIPKDAFPALAEDVEITLRKAGSVGRIVAVSPDFPDERNLPFVRGADGSVSFVLPRSALTAYTIVKVQGR